MQRSVTGRIARGSCWRHMLLAALVIGVFAALTSSAYASSSCLNSTIASNFNGTAIPGGTYIWFNANFKPTGVSGRNVTIHFTNSTIKFSVGGTPQTLAVPDATINFSTSATKATTEKVGGEWVTTVPSSFGDDVFLSGFAFHVPSGGLPGGINPVTWQGSFTTTSSGVGVSWKWGAAVYKPTEEAAKESVIPKPVHSTSLDEFHNGDQAGTPENFKRFVIGGARGGGGSNWTGSWSGTNSCTPPSTPPPGGPHIFVGYVDEAANNHGSPSAHPNPWKGSAGVKFIGCGFGGSDKCPTSGGFDLYDAGAIRIEATSESGALSVTGGKVVIGPCTYEPWPGLNVTIQPGENLILTQTGKHQCTSTLTAEQDNFDTSESFLKSTQYQEFLNTGTCSNDGFIPAITLTINGQTTTLNDSGQTLNTGGLDPDICTGTSEVREWSQLQ
jgi:hypothetical protein